MLILLFVLIVLSPCAVAFLGGREEPAVQLIELPREEPAQGWVEAPGVEQHVMFTETPLADRFEVKAFPKGLKLRRVLLQDRVGEMRLHIRQLRTAVWEQMQKAGLAAERIAVAAERAAVSRAVLLKRLAAEARATWERTTAARAREARLALERRVGWADADEYARWRWRAVQDEGFEAA